MYVIIFLFILEIPVRLRVFRHIFVIIILRKMSLIAMVATEDRFMVWTQLSGLANSVEVPYSTLSNRKGDQYLSLDNAKIRVSLLNYTAECCS